MKRNIKNGIEKFEHKRKEAYYNIGDDFYYTSKGSIYNRYGSYYSTNKFGKESFIDLKNKFEGK